MTTHQQSGPEQRHDQVIERGLAFLAGRQMSSGELAVLHGDIANGVLHFESTPFGTALVVLCLQASSHPLGEQICDRACGFLLAEMEEHGAWRHWSRSHSHHTAIPLDVDDTACASLALSQRHQAFPANRRLLLANRDRSGRFYTWLTPRLGPIAREADFWRVVVPRLFKPMTSAMFWRQFDATPRDIDCVVNANVLRYLGEGPGTEAVSRYLVQTIERGGAVACDRWYQSEIALYYAVAACIHNGNASLTHARRTIIARLDGMVNADGAIGSSALETAMAATTLWRCGGDREIVRRASNWLAGKQGTTGGWPIAELYYSGPARAVAFGSEELTTAFCLEALLGTGQETAGVT